MTTKIQKFADKEYRHAYAESFLDTFIATQIRVLREQRELTQAELAELVGMKQSRISTVEDAAYSGWTLSTLKRLARAFDVPLSVSFGTFGRLLLDVRGFRRDHLERPEFADDPAFNLSAAAMTDSGTAPSPAAISHEDTFGRLLDFQTKSSRTRALTTRSTMDTTFTTAIARTR
jgi:transcriptional regulator with XRE-family HTH domain